MIVVDYSRTSTLFSQYDLRASLESGRTALAADADRSSVAADSSDADLQRLAQALADKHSINVPEIDEAEIYTSSERRELDVSQDFGRAIFDRSQPRMLSLEAVVFHVPYSGDKELLLMRASRFSLNPPRAEISGSELRIAVMTEGEVTAELVKRTFQNELERIKEALGWVSSDIGADYNARVLRDALAALEAKRNRQTSTRSLLDDLGFKTQPTTTPVSVSSPRVEAVVEAVEPPSLPESPFKYDFFISHASEDKDAVARPLYERLKTSYRVWFDEAELHMGDSLLDKIDEGLANCRFGIVIMSPRFFSKKWTQEELKGLRARQVDAGPAIILPVWNEVDAKFLNEIHPSLSQIKAANMADGLDAVVAQIEDAYLRQSR